MRPSNYLPHNGVATIQQFIDATTSVFGMGEVCTWSSFLRAKHRLTSSSQDLAVFLATYGAVLDGALTSWSIAGGPHVGIGGSHNNYEGDSSPLRGDLDQYGSNTKLIMSQFKTVRALLRHIPYLH